MGEQASKIGKKLEQFGENFFANLGQGNKMHTFLPLQSFLPQKENTWNRFAM